MDDLFANPWSQGQLAFIDQDALEICITSVGLDVVREDSHFVLVLVVVVLIVGPKLFIEPGAKAFLQLSSEATPDCE